MNHGDEIFAQMATAIAVVLAACWLVGTIAKWAGQPRVVGEMIAGVTLGPSLLGRFFPQVQDALFPDHLMGLIFALSQLGLVLYMFTIGLEFNVADLKVRARAGAAVSAAGLLAPLILGAGLAVFLHSAGDLYFPTGTPLATAMLFCGAALATTAFPMLARIIEERGISRTPLGTLALTAGAVDDLAAWLILALVLAVLSGSPTVALVALAGAALYVVLVLYVGGPLLSAAGRRASGKPETLLVLVLILVLLGALFTNGVGIHAIFGGFFLGAVFPREQGLNDAVRRTLQPVVKSLLLPLFFIYSGLNTELGLVQTWDLAIVAIGIIAIAVLAKGAACYTAARLCTVSHRESMAIGSLMNARGLIELILLNIALSAGLITPTLFTMLVMMAIVTTLMATPLFHLVYGRHLQSDRPAEPVTIPVPDDRTARSPLV